MRGYYLKDRTQLESLARCYASAFGRDSFTVSLGLDYIAKNLEWFLVNPTAAMYVIEDDMGEVIAFLGSYVKMENGSGSTSSMLAYSANLRGRILRKKPWLFLNLKLIKKVLHIVIDNPSFLVFRVFSIFRIDSQSKVSPLNKEDYSLGLVVIGIKTEHQGTTVSSSLMEAFRAKLSETGLRKAHLSVNSSNLRAIRYYKRFGWCENRDSKKTSRSLSMILVLEDHK